MTLELKIIGPALPDAVREAAIAAVVEALEGQDPVDCARCWALWERHLDEGGRPLSEEEEYQSILWDSAASAMEFALAKHGIYGGATLSIGPAQPDARQASLI